MKLNRVLCCIWIAMIAAPLFAADAAPANKWEKAIENFEKEDAAAMPAPGGILFTGSSSIRFWKLDEAFPDLPVINRGFGGSEYSDLLYHFDRIFPKYQPKVVVLYSGDNDISAGKTPAAVLEDYRTLIAKIEETLPDVKVITVGIKPSNARWDIYPDHKAVNDGMQQHCAEKPFCMFMDTAPLSLGGDGKPDDSLFLKDRLHLNEAGYAKWNETIKPLLIAAMGE